MQSSTDLSRTSIGAQNLSSALSEAHGFRETRTTAAAKAAPAASSIGKTLRRGAATAAASIGAGTGAGSAGKTGTGTEAATGVGAGRVIFLGGNRNSGTYEPSGNS